MTEPDIADTARTVPLCVDLDGTLVKTDTLWESLIGLLLKNPFLLFAAVAWIFRGKAVLKNEVAARIDRDASSWPYREEVIDFLKSEKQRGRYIVLATGAPEKVAQPIADHLGLFDEVLHTTSQVNLTAHRKRDKLIERFGAGGFDYVGDSRDDVAVFEAANRAILVAPDGTASRWADSHDADVLVESRMNLKLILKAMRVHQWLKNVLLAVPLVLLHELLNFGLLVSVITAFFSFSFAASSIYLFNDLTDLENDRLHHRKKNRPLASGALSIASGMKLASALLAGSVVLALFLPATYFGVLLIYIAATTAYSFVLKRKLLVDVFTLAGLFTLRIIAGAAAIQVALSFWLLAFSIFFFLSLALVKRYVELLELSDEKGSKKLGRGYYALDFDMIGQAGISSAFGAALVLALYIHSDEVQEMYRMPALLWPLCPMVVYMLLRIWMIARRGEVHDDPVVFIMGDWRSQLVMAIGAVLVILAATAYPL
ncbi:UbiA family prenyltransferase [Hoeflea prorocentri]|uniref:UbiA family prenyltransferase n=1 Tax=Hoeflea prorocentri TaxID=1922333 RepID=A0A9X3UIY1_9HYPH|nr:UbiA family prenyltransferase [Hoeflea prorocentri]MCY6380029.1 UbiA family prenyltransferase [Hoeflea prorocentri]MDA5397829.1 UbiA family prenyltransferase [Hoeflea prorocentri]